MYVYTYISDGVLDTVKVSKDLEWLKKHVIEHLSSSFRVNDEEAEIRDEDNQTVFNFNRFYSLINKLEDHPFPFRDVRFERTVSKGEVFKAVMIYTSGRKEEVEILAKYKTDRIEIILKRDGEKNGAYYDTIYNI